MRLENPPNLLGNRKKPLHILRNGDSPVCLASVVRVGRRGYDQIRPFARQPCQYFESIAKDHRVRLYLHGAHLLADSGLCCYVHCSSFLTLGPDYSTFVDRREALPYTADRGADAFEDGEFQGSWTEDEGAGATTDRS